MTQSSAGSATLPEWEDPRVQKVYAILCDHELNTPPNPEEHWEGWVSRNIVAALCGSAAADAREPVAWRWRYGNDNFWTVGKSDPRPNKSSRELHVEPLFTCGAAQGSQDDEIFEIKAYWHERMDKAQDRIRDLEALLRSAQSHLQTAWTYGGLESPILEIYLKLIDEALALSSTEGE